MPSDRIGRYGGAKATPQHNARIAKEVPIPDDRRNVVPDLEEDARRWYVCTTGPQTELRAAASIRRLAKRGFDLTPYVPCEFEWRRAVRSNLRVPRREMQRPVLRGYLFVGSLGAIVEREMAALRETDVDGRNAHGLVAILGTAHGPRPMDDDGLAWLRGHGEDERAGRTNRTPVGAFTFGEEVRIGSGPFSGFPARFMALGPEGETALVEISLMASRTELRLPVDDVLRAG